MRFIDRLVSHGASHLGLGSPMVINTHLGHIGEATRGGSKQGPRNDFLVSLKKSRIPR